LKAALCPPFLLFVLIWLFVAFPKISDDMHNESEVKMITGEKLKQEAKDILPIALEEAKLAWYQDGNYDDVWLKSAEENSYNLIYHIDAPTPPSPQYTRMSELSAELIYMSWHHEDELSNSLEVLKRDPSDRISIRDIKGFSRIHDFYRAVCDDHEYSLDTSGNGPVITICDENIFTITPNSLIEALQNHREVLENTSTPKI
jgi:hypothetical protein